MKPFAYGFAAFDAETCPQPGDAKIFQLLLDSRKIAWRKFHDSGGCLIHEVRKSKRAVIDLLRREAPWCKVMVGGAVLTEDYARRMGADFYGKDAMSDVRYADGVTEAG